MICSGATVMTFQSQLFLWRVSESCLMNNAPTEGKTDDANTTKSEDASAEDI